MIDHPYTPHPVPGFTNRDQCEYRLKDEPGICAEPKSAHAAALLGRGEVQNPREGQPGDAETYEGKPLFEKGPQEPAPFAEKRRWPRKVGWTKLLARRKACSHTFGEPEFGVRVQWAASQCPRCLADEVAYWKGRTHSAEGQRDAMLRVVEKAIRDELIVAPLAKAVAT